LDKCVENIRRYFGKDATWHPIGPLVREALHTHHADELHHINLSDQDWHNIIDINGWDRGPRKRGPKDKLRIGRHSRDHVHKWPDCADDILAAYPDRADVEVHVLGGGKTPAGILGNIPKNWVVHEFGSIHPRDFLRDIDVWVYFANPVWVESFGRTIIEAMAVGVPVILPEIYRPLFQDSALYATSQTALEMAQKLHADPMGYDRHVAKSKAYVRDHFSFEMHVARLKNSGVDI
jgi:glycosyltransferase involved in cell wall biosynthesis